MEILNYLSDIYKYFSIFILINTRIMAFFSTFVVFKRELITVRIIMSLSIILSLYVFLLQDKKALQIEIFSIYMFKNMLMEFVIGFAAGLILNFIFESFSVAGQFISTQIGLSIASLIDNRLVFITPLTEFYFIVATLLFFLLNGHLFIIKMMLSSYHTYPLLSDFHGYGLINTVLSFSKSMFTQAVSLSITITVIVILCNLTLAILSKMAPQFNLFSIGINIQLLLGLLTLYFTFTFFVTHSEDAMTLYLNKVSTQYLGVKHDG